MSRHEIATSGEAPDVAADEAEEDISANEAEEDISANEAEEDISANEAEEDTSANEAEVASREVDGAALATAGSPLDESSTVCIPLSMDHRPSTTSSNT